jgi:hypothetical protein
VPSPAPIGITEMKDKWLIVILAIVGWLIYRSVKERSLGMSNATMIAPIGNTTVRIGQQPLLALVKQTRMLAERIVVASAGTPVQLPEGKPVSEVRLSTAGNTGTVYLGTSYVETQSPQHRFSIITSQNISLPFKVTNLNLVWVDAATNNDAVSILCEVESN